MVDFAFFIVKIGVDVMFLFGFDFAFAGDRRRNKLCNAVKYINIPFVCWRYGFVEDGRWGRQTAHSTAC